MASPNDIRKGTVVNLDGELWAVASFQRVSPGKGSSFVRTRLKSLSSGKMVEHNFKSAENLTYEDVGYRKMQFIFGDDSTLTLMDGLREVDFGAWTGLSWDDVQTRHGVSAFTWLTQLEDGTIEKAETVRDFRQRVEIALDQILAEAPGKNIAVICHGGVIRMLLAILFDMPFRKMSMFEIEYASVTKVHYKPSKREIEFLNLTPWRDYPN